MIIRKPYVLTILLPFGLLMSASCASDSNSNSSDTVLGGPAPTAREVTEHLVSALEGTKLLKDYTAADDPNDLLGRPGGYTSKTAFSDSRISPIELEYEDADSIARGGSVEVFSDSAGAKARMEYIQGIAKALPIATEYDYISGHILLRVSAELTPEQAGDYEDVLKTLRN